MTTPEATPSAPVLPPLPEPIGSVSHWIGTETPKGRRYIRSQAFSADQMQAYALAAIAAQQVVPDVDRPDNWSETEEFEAGVFLAGRVQTPALKNLRVTDNQWRHLCRLLRNEEIVDSFAAAMLASAPLPPQKNPDHLDSGVCGGVQVPLTQAQITNRIPMGNEALDWVKFARRIEAAHGIKEQS